MGGALAGEAPLWEAPAGDEDQRVALQWTLGSHTAVS